MTEKKNVSTDQPYHLYLTREDYNHMLQTLALLEKIETGNPAADEIANDAAVLKQTLLRFTKKSYKKGDDRAVVILFEREACPLIKLMLLYIGAFRKTEPHDFFSDIRKDIRRETI